MNAPVVDVLIIGAGASGIAAARRVLASGRSALMLEARDRIGGRAVTVPFKGHPVDLGAHWIHASGINPLVKAAREGGQALSRARYAFTSFRHGETLGIAASWALDAAWEKAENRIFAAADRIDQQGGDIALQDAIGHVGPWTEAVTFMHANYDCGAPAERISTVDFARVNDDKDLLVEGGLGGLVAHLGQGLPVRLGAEVVAVAHDETGVVVRLADGGTVAGRTAILALPLMVLAAGHITFTPALPAPMQEALAGFHPAVYEHVLLHSVDPPWGRRANRIVLSMTGEQHVVLFGRMDGTDLHYLDMVGDDGLALAALPAQARPEAAMAVLRAHFGPSVDQRVEVLHVTNWSSDPYARAAWALASIGGAPFRAVLRQPVGALHVAGEAASQAQWGTVGGAWEEGERAAMQALARLGPASA